MSQPHHDEFNNGAPPAQEQNHPERPDMTGRRGFLRWAVHGLGAVFTVILGAPAVAYLIDPRNRKATESRYRDVAMLDELPADGKPYEFVVRETTRDAWTLMPNEVIGRVFLIRRGPIEGNNLNIDAFSTVCPHLGCAVNYIPNDQQVPLRCPCHDGRFDLQGRRLEVASHPAKRDMLQLQVRRKPSDQEVIQVEYRTFDDVERQNEQLA